MVPGLFHRAILLSGSAFSSWALVEDPVLYALKLAKEVNCTIPEDLIKNHEQIVDCLREVPLEELYSTEIQAPSFLTAFGPSVILFHLSVWMFNALPTFCAFSLSLFVPLVRPLLSKYFVLDRWSGYSKWIK